MFRVQVLVPNKGTAHQTYQKPRNESHWLDLFWNEKKPVSRSLSYFHLANSDCTVSLGNCMSSSNMSTASVVTANDLFHLTSSWLDMSVVYMHYLLFKEFFFSLIICNCCTAAHMTHLKENMLECYSNRSPSFSWNFRHFFILRIPYEDHFMHHPNVGLKGKDNQ